MNTTEVNACIFTCNSHVVLANSCITSKLHVGPNYTQAVVDLPAIFYSVHHKLSYRGFSCFLRAVKNCSSCLMAVFIFAVNHSRLDPGTTDLCRQHQKPQMTESASNRINSQIEQPGHNTG